MTGRPGVPRSFAGPIAVAIIAVLAVAPVVAVLASFRTGPDVWPSRAADYLAGTGALCAIVGLAAAALGSGAAARVALTDFPGRRVFSFALVAPFAVPAYISAYAYADLFSPFGSLSRWTLLEIRSLPGAAFILTLSVYPYVYLATRASLSARSDALIEAARSLGASPLEATRRVLAPAARPALAGGLALALMETAADYGVADYFGVRTLSTGIFRTWHGRGDLAAASQLASVLFAIALILVILEASSRRGAVAESARAARAATRFRLSGLAALSAFLFCASLVFLGFAAPVGILTANALGAEAGAAPRGFVSAVTNTAAIAGAGAALTISVSIILAYAGRALGENPAARLALRLATLGYALPGAVIAIGLLTVISAAPGVSTVGAGAGLLLYAYAARFLTAGYNAAAGGLEQIHPDTENAARSLGAGTGAILARIQLPLTRGAIGAGALIIFIDIAKELPATLLLRPFNFETIATRVYRLASDERLADAAPAALILIFMGVVAAALLNRLGENATR